MKKEGRRKADDISDLISGAGIREPRGLFPIDHRKNQASQRKEGGRDLAGKTKKRKDRGRSMGREKLRVKLLVVSMEM